jgi:hypothetical protein
LQRLIKGFGSAAVALESAGIESRSSQPISANG